METNETIDRITSSKNFSNKEVLKGLLKFLYEASKDGKNLKETDIAIGYFKRGNTFIPGEDTIVRVNIYKLRSLLEKYYQEEGFEDSTVLEIPKGSYQLHFKKPVAAPVETKKSSIRLAPKLIMLGFVLSLLANIVFLVSDKLNNTKLYNPVWSSYLNSSRPVYITLGDPFFYRIKDPSSNGSLIVRDITINSKSELTSRDLQAQHKVKDEQSELNYPYFSRNNLWPLPSILSFFAKSDMETRLQALSESNIDDIKNNNVIFIANINSFGWMNKFLERSSIKLFTNPREIHINRPKDSVVLKVPEVVNGSYLDYAFLVKLPGPNKNTITMMGDFHASGLKGLSNIISQKESMEKLVKEIEAKYGRFPPYFEMVVKVTSYNYSDFETKLIHFKPISL